MTTALNSKGLLQHSSALNSKKQQKILSIHGDQISSTRLQQPQQRSGPTTSCQEVTRERLRLHLQMRRPAEFAIDQDTLNTPIHRLLESPDSRVQPEQTGEMLQRLLADLASVGYLASYINLANRRGSTPLSICLLTEQFSGLISVLISHGAQLHHVCGGLAERNNHLHFAMSRSAPRTIDSTLDEVFRTYPSGADGMYAQNSRGETPKAALMRRVEEAAFDWREPHLVGQLARILDRIPAYPPYSGLPSGHHHQHQQLQQHQQQQFQQLHNHHHQHQLQQHQLGPLAMQPEMAARLRATQLDAHSGR